MIELPPDLRASLPEGSVAAAESWWRSLAEPDRTRIAGLWDRRIEVRFFAPQADEAGDLDAWDAVPNVAGGRFARIDGESNPDWASGYFEHLLQHPELVIGYEPEGRTFHICTRHAAARHCLEQGRVPDGFACPVDDATCPMERLRGARLESPTAGCTWMIVE